MFSNRKYDFILIGGGLFSLTFANLCERFGGDCLIIEKRDVLGGNCVSKSINNIDVHLYGPHIFHTNDRFIWDYINQFTDFYQFNLSVKSKVDNNIYSFPINLMTLYQIFGVTNPTEANELISRNIIKIENPKNFEEVALSSIGKVLYEKFIYGYTKKQWGREPKDLPSYIFNRLPIRLSFNDNYYYDEYQGIPVNGYTSMLHNMITDKTDVILNYSTSIDDVYKLVKKLKSQKKGGIIITAPIDEFYWKYTFGKLEYRTLTFDIKEYNIPDYQGTVVMTYPSEKIPYTRIVEHKHFTPKITENTVIVKEFPSEWEVGNERYYPINTKRNNDLYLKYKSGILEMFPCVYLGGRLGSYKYYDMDDTISEAFKLYDVFVNK